MAAAHLLKKELPGLGLLLVGEEDGENKDLEPGPECWWEGCKNCF